MAVKRSIPKRPEPKICPTCWNDMDLTDAGYVCPRHGLVTTGPTKVARPSAAQPPTKVAQSRPKRPPNPRQETRQTQRMTEMVDVIIARNQAGESIAAIAADVWHVLGYTNQHVCASKISRFLRKRGVKAAEMRSGPPPGAQPASRYSDERLTVVQAAIAQGETVWAFAGSHWQAWGFPSQHACDSLIRKWLRTKELA